MKKNKVIIFTKNNARILINPDLRALSDFKNKIINPDLSKVRAVPSHFWKLDSVGNVVPMTDKEQAVRLKDIKEYGVDNLVIPKTKYDPKRMWGYVEKVASIFFVISSVIFFYLAVSEGFPYAIRKLAGISWWPGP